MLCFFFVCSLCAAAPFISVAVLCSFISSRSVLRHLSFLLLCCVPLYPVDLRCGTFHFHHCVVLLLCVQSVCVLMHLSFQSPMSMTGHGTRKAKDSYILRH